MLKTEFEELTRKDVTSEDYKIIEEVYTWHPAIDGRNGKRQIADLYLNVGMRIIRDMLPTAEKAKTLSEEIRVQRAKLSELEHEYTKLRAGV